MKINANKYSYKIKEIKICLNKSNIYAVLLTLHYITYVI